MYEFNEDEDEVIARLAVSMSNVGFLSLFGGMLTLLKVLFISVVAVMIGYVALGMLSIVSCVLQLAIAGRSSCESASTSHGTEVARDRIAACGWFALLFKYT